MNARAVSYPSLQRRLAAKRRSRALFLARSTQHVGSGTSLLCEILRAAAALGAVAAWGALIVLFAP